MKKSVALVVSLFFVFAAVTMAFAAKGPSGKFAGKAGDTIYVCSCGDSCDCGTLGSKAGTCGCGKELVKTTINKIEKGKVFYTVNGKEMSAPATGKYACGCGEGCNCNFISQKPGKCGCDKEMVKVGKAEKAKKK